MLVDMCAKAFFKNLSVTWEKIMQRYQNKGLHRNRDFAQMYVFHELLNMLGRYKWYT